MRGKFHQQVLKERPRAVAIVLLVILTVVTFHGVFRNGFIQMDDDVNIYKNRYFVEAPLENVGAFWSDLEGYEHLWVPLTYTVWAVLAEMAALPFGSVDGKSGDVVMAGFDSTVFHAANLLMHLVATLLCFTILRRLLGKGATLWPAVAGAALFAVHPLHVEPVAWATGMKDLLSTVFIMAAILAYLRAREDGGARSSGRLPVGKVLVAEAGTSLLVIGVILSLFFKELIGAGWFGALALGWYVAEVLRRTRGAPWYGVAALAYLAALL